MSTRSGAVVVAAVTLSLLALPAPAGAAAAAAVQTAADGIPADLRNWATSNLATQQWHLDDVRASQAWSVSKGDGIVVAVVDSGVDASHPDMTGQLVDGAVVFTSRGEARVQPVVAGLSQDFDGHGTHVAGLIAARDNGKGTLGVAPEVSIMPVQLYFNGTMTDVAEQIASGINFAAVNGADVINLSLAGPVLERNFPTTPDEEEYDQFRVIVCDAVAAADAAGAVVIAAAGNNGDPLFGGNPPFAPAICPQAVSVVATGPDHRRTWWSSFDQRSTIAAPGDMLLSTLPTDPNAALSSPLGYAPLSGTSMAAPVVAGVAALTRAAYPNYTPAQIRARLTSTAIDLGAKGRDPIYGAGLVDAAAAVGVANLRTDPGEDRLMLYTGARQAQVQGLEEVTLTWLPPARPIVGYTLRVWDTRSDAVARVHRLDADQVRDFTSVRRGNWAQLTAEVLDGGQTVTVVAPPVYLPAEAPPPPPYTTVTGMSASRLSTARPDQLRVNLTPGEAWESVGTVIVEVFDPATGDSLRTWEFNRNGSTLANSWQLPLPAVAVNGEFQVFVAVFGADMASFSQVVTASRVLGVSEVSRLGTETFASGRIAAQHIGPGTFCGTSRCTGSRVAVSVKAQGFPDRTWSGRIDRHGTFTVWGTLPTKVTKVTVQVTLTHGGKKQMSFPVTLNVTKL